MEKLEAQHHRRGSGDTNLKLALIADIHSNVYALRQCLNFCKENRVDGYVFLGDMISDCPNPQKTMELIYEIKEKEPCWFIRGNREEYQLSYRHGEQHWQHGSSLTGNLLYTYEHLTEKDFHFFDSLPIWRRIMIEGTEPFTICHGSQQHSRTLLHVGSEAAYQALRECDTNLLICAHTHIQGLTRLGDKCLINPGSVGIPMQSQGKLQFAFLEWTGRSWEVNFFSQEYDKNILLSEYESSGLLEQAKFYAKSVMCDLQYGKNKWIDVLECALAMAGNEEPTEAQIELAYQKCMEEYNIC
ncbi:MAG: metallophosphoesterase family protein [Lachnospiraceae bacterium]